ncbi:MAG: ArnT family glycosyltransferase [Rubricella sp.]
MGALLDRLGARIAGAIDRASERPALAFGLVALVALIILLPGQAGLPVTDRDEGRYVQATTQMLETGDFIDIRFQDNPRWVKPVGIYWLQAAAATITGYGADAPIWVHRLPSLLGILAASLLTIWAARPIAGPRAGVIAGLIVASATITMGEGNIAKTDAALLATVVLAQGALVRIWLDDAARFDMTRWLFWIALALGVLIKGPIILLVSGGTLLWLCIAERDLAPLRQTAPLRGLVLLLLVAGPWFIAIGIVTDMGFYGASVGDDLLGKVGDSSNNHWGPPGYYLMTMWITFWPWAVLMLLAAPFAWAERRGDTIHFLAGWIVPFWFVFAVTTTKLPHYTMPILPGLAILVGWWLTSANAEVRRPVLALIGAALFMLGGGVLVTVTIWGPLEVDGAVDTLSASLGMLALLIMLVAAAALVLWRLWAFVGLALASALVLLPTISGVTLPRLETLFPSPAIASFDARLDICAPHPVVSAGYHEPSLVFLAGTDTELVDLDRAAERLATGGPGIRVWLDTSRRGHTPEALAALVGAELSVIGAIDGLNYNRGDRTTILAIAPASDTTLAGCVD